MKCNKSLSSLVSRVGLGLLWMKNHTLKPVSGFKRVIFLFYVLFSYTIAFSAIFLKIPTSWFLSVLLPVFDCYLLCLVIHLFSLARLKPIGWLFGFFAAWLFFGELFTLFYYHSYYSMYVIQLVFETNLRESMELMDSSLKHPALWYSVLGFALVSVLTFGISYLIRKPFRYKPILSFLVFAVIVWSGIRQFSAYRKLYLTFVDSEIAIQNHDSGKMPHLNTPLVRLLHSIAFNKAQTMSLDVLQASVEAATVDSCSFRSPLILLVIGESYNKHHAHIYNPSSLPTTPCLERLQSSGHLTVLKDVVSPYNGTSEVFKSMFSLWDEGCEGDWTLYPLFPAIFKKAGYRVCFLTNQFIISTTDFYDVVGGTIFNRPRLSELQFTYRNSKIYDYDLELLQELPPSDTLTTNATLLIVHLLGQHVAFKERYPEEYTHFKPHEEPTPFGGNTGKKIASEYDNATYYNDVVVDSIFRTFKDTECVGIYLADHGEEAYDWRPSSGRTSEAEITKEIARNQYEIPFMFYTSDSYAARHPDIVEQIHGAVDKPFLSTDLAHLLLYLGGIHTSLYKEKLNILSPAYDAGRKRVIHYDTDYDQLMGHRE